MTAACSSGSPASAPANSPSPSASPSTSSPSASSSASATATSTAALQRFYRQHLAWHDCGDSFSCASLLVPLDYAHPDGATMHVAVIRQRATGSSHGSLIINPGGPGASGVQFERDAAFAFDSVTEHLDLVSFDPRGVGGSKPIRCLSSADLDRYFHTDPEPTTKASRDRLIQISKSFELGCRQRNGSYLAHVGTIDAARDMDVLRAALGDKKLTYYGASYGTYLGAKYAQLFPTRIRAMVLDGAVNPADDTVTTDIVQSRGFETNLDDFLAWCVRHGCPLGSSTADAQRGLDRLEAKVRSHPEAVGSRSLGAGEFFIGLASGFYSTSEWPGLRRALAQAQQGNGAGLLAFADSLTERHRDGSYSNLMESNMAINCIDRPWPRSASVFEQNAVKFGKSAPYFGAAIEYGSMPCAFWRVPPVEGNHPVSAPGAPPILVIGTTRDPATPFVWAKALARQLSSGVLLTHDGDGHTVYSDHDSCVDAVVANYVLHLNPPKACTVCH